MTPTPEERAESVDIVVDEMGDPRDPQNYVNYEKTTANIAAAIREAVAAENEACAVLIEAREVTLPDAVRACEYSRGSLASAIRARSNP